MSSEHRRAKDIRQSVMRLAQRLRAERPPDALSSNKLIVLSYLQRDGPSTPGQIATASRQHPQSLTRVFSDLQLAGLVSRSRSPSDGRESILTITPAGESAFAADMALRDDWLNQALSALSDAEVDLLGIAAGLMQRISDSPATDAAIHGPTS